jgi:anti-sigma factor ChrR (cupin superfamily)
MVSSLCCDQCEEQLPGYALRALEPEETLLVAAHLRICGCCQATLEAFDAVLDRLAQAVVVHDPPLQLRQRLLAAVIADLSRTAQAPFPPWAVW